ncbi:MAG: YbhB/YbcL family Raf kinase inhibitor-like protein [Caulobacterales bacterium]
MRIWPLVLAVSLCAGCGRAAPIPPTIALAHVQPQRPTPIAVTSSAIGTDGRIGDRYSAYGDNLSPPVSWTPVDGARAYAIVLEDPNAPGDNPFVHWMIWNISGDAHQLPQGLPNMSGLATLGAARQGKNDSGTFGYYGPHPPAGGSAHRYHFEVFALDGPLDVHADADLPTLTAAMKGHVLADGELAGTYRGPAAEQRSK